MKLHIKSGAERLKRYTKSSLGHHRDDQSTREVTGNDESHEHSNLNDLVENLDSIYNSYTNTDRGSVDTLETGNGTSSKARYLVRTLQDGGDYRHGTTNPPEAKPFDTDESERKLYPDRFLDTYTYNKNGSSANSSSDFDFTPYEPAANKNSSLNVLISKNSIGKEYEELTGSVPSLPESMISRKLTSATEHNLNKNGQESDVHDSSLSDESIPYDQTRSPGEIPPEDRVEESDAGEWDSKGAAVGQIKYNSGEGYKIIKRTVLDFTFGKALGDGSYSTVVLATDNHTGRQYAVKILDKRHIIKEKKVKYVNIEKHALNRLSNRQGIISLYFTFQDKASLYFVLDYASNGELLSLLKKYGTLNEEATKYFGAQILDAIKYMHDNGVIHRDIKPENILLDKKNRILITDFGTARLLEKKNDESEDYPIDVRAKSFVGTAEYVSPELLDSKYSGKPGDLWAFGCILYQLIAGKPPFKAANEYLTFQKITKLQFAFSAGFPMVLRDLIKQILVLQPSKRATIPMIQKHFFFKSIDFDNFDAIWLKDPPELGPYKMNAKAMMKVPEINKRNPSLPQVSTVKKLVPKLHVNGQSDLPLPKSADSDNDNSPRVNPASVAAFVLHRNGSTDGGETDTDKEATRATGSIARSEQDYIPGTNILRPKINNMQKSYTRNSTAKKPKPRDTKPKVLAVPPLSALELSWTQYLVHPDERILKIGPVLVQRQDTAFFERRYKGNIREAPLGFSSKFNSKSSSLLSQVVNGSNQGLRSRSSVLGNRDSDDSEDESKAIIDHYEVEEPEESSQSHPPSSSDPSTIGSSGGRLTKSILKKFLPAGNLASENDGTSDTSDFVERQNPLVTSKTCTMLITSLGRVLVFFRNDQDANYKLICEIKLNHPFIQIKEVVSVRTRYQRSLPTTGIFAIMSLATTFVYEVENHEVNQWTENLATSKLNQYEREKADLASPDDKGKSEEIQGSQSASSPKLQASPKLQPSPSLTNNPKPNPPANKERREARIKLPPISTARASATPKESSKSPKSPPDSRHHASLLNEKLKKPVKRKPPPPLSPPSGIDLSTGLAPTNDNETMMNAAKLAVANNPDQSATRSRSSFSRGTERPATKLPSSRPNSPEVTQMNSKFLARSQRKKH